MALRFDSAHLGCALHIRGNMSQLNDKQRAKLQAWFDGCQDSVLGAILAPEWLEELEAVVAEMLEEATRSRDRDT